LPIDEDTCPTRHLHDVKKVITSVDRDTLMCVRAFFSRFSKFIWFING
jgi:hypothetical protein